MYLYTNKYHLSWLMVSGEAPLTWYSSDEMSLRKWGCTNDLSWIQHLNFVCKKEVCKSITWECFTTCILNMTSNKLQKHTALWSNTHDVCASTFKGAVLDSWHAMVWEEQMTWCTWNRLCKTGWLPLFLFYCKSDHVCSLSILLGASRQTDTPS